MPGGLDTTLTIGFEPAVYCSLGTPVGAMLDVVAATELVVTGFDLHIFGTDTHEVRLFTREGTLRGREREPEAWELVGVRDLVACDFGRPTHLAIRPLPVAARQTRAFYLVVASGAMALDFASEAALGDPRLRIGTPTVVGRGLFGPDVVAGLVPNAILHYRYPLA